MHIAMTAIIVVAGFIYVIISTLLLPFQQPHLFSIDPAIYPGHFLISAQLCLLHPKAHSFVFRNASVANAVLDTFFLAFMVLFVRMMTALRVGKLAYKQRPNQCSRKNDLFHKVSSSFK
jgi:hypothetical protein